MTGGQSLILKLMPSDALHLVAALQQYRKRCQADALPYPRALQAMEREVSTEAMRGQAGPTFADALQSLDNRTVNGTLLTYSQAAAKLACSVRTVKRRVACGELVPVRNGNVVRLKASDIDAFIEQGATAC